MNGAGEKQTEHQNKTKGKTRTCSFPDASISSSTSVSSLVSAPQKRKGWFTAFRCPRRVFDCLVPLPLAAPVRARGGGLGRVEAGEFPDERVLGEGVAPEERPGCLFGVIGLALG